VARGGLPPLWSAQACLRLRTREQSGKLKKSEGLPSHSTALTSRRTPQAACHPLIKLEKRPADMQNRRVRKTGLVIVLEFDKGAIEPRLWILADDPLQISATSSA